MGIWNWIVSNLLALVVGGIVGWNLVWLTGSA